MSESLFLRDCYLQTGWLATPDLLRQVAVGDVFQIQAGQLLNLASLPALHLTHAAQLSPAIPLSSQDFCLQNGVSSKTWQIEAATPEPLDSYSSRLELEFAWPGSYLFRCQTIQAEYLMNWQQLRDDLILKLSQLHYQFRQVYVVTAVARAEHWDLSIAGQAEASLIYASSNQTAHYFDLLGAQQRQLQASRGLARQQSSANLPAHFIQAKALTLSDSAKDKMLRQIIEGQAGTNAMQRANWLRADWMNLFKNPDPSLNSCIDLFSWRDFNLDDVEKLNK